MKPKTPPIDTTLTAENASERGYTFVCDVFPAFVEENKELIDALLTAGCVLGVASAGNREGALGLYQRVQSEQLR
jgi:hypothetical protein